MIIQFSESNLIGTSTKNRTLDLQSYKVNKRSGECEISRNTPGEERLYCY